jgi:hypothetical protein
MLTMFCQKVHGRKNDYQVLIFKEIQAYIIIL